MNTSSTAVLSVRIKRLGYLLVWVFLAGLVGCGDAGSPTMVTVDKQPEHGAAAKPAAPRPKIALVMKTLTNPFFLEVEKGARRAESALDIELVVKTAAQETSIEQQMLIIDDLIKARINAIVITPGDSQRLIPVLKKAAAAGIKLVN
ncbi:MAG TPA: substrate-binding domain-containing protein, partial [Rhodoferax sp.]|nr:substrate-binding domain-containing protein [Rhodoferax sp.]